MPPPLPALWVLHTLPGVWRRLRVCEWPAGVSSDTREGGRRSARSSGAAAQLLWLRQLSREDRQDRDE